MTSNLFQTAILASGSKGNCTFIQTESSAVLLDAGLSGIKIISALESIDADISKIKAVIVSHEHSDHISGVGIIARRLQIPIYITEQTYNICRTRLEPVKHGYNFFEHGKMFTIGDIEIDAFPSSHDVVDGSNFLFMKKGCSNKKLAHATDLGFSSRLMLFRFKEASTVIIESNHDEKMLWDGPYPIHLKQRVKSKQGHLSNMQAVEVISKILHPELKNLILAHLSEQNNIPELAFKIMNDYLIKMKYDLNLLVSSQYEATELVDI